MYNGQANIPNPTFDNGPSGGGFNPGIAGAFGIGAGLLGSMFGGGQPNPANAGMPYLNQANQTLQPFINQGIGATQPYLQAGNAAIPGLQHAIGSMMNNPGGFINGIGQNFHQSPGYQFQVDQARAQANAAGAAGGIAGTPAEQAGLAGTVNGLANQDYYNWLHSALNQYNTGFNGLQNMFNTGASTANNMYSAAAQAANNMAGNQENQATMAYNGQINQNQSNPWNTAIGAAGQGLGIAGALGFL